MASAPRISSLLDSPSRVRALIAIANALIIAAFIGTVVWQSSRDRAPSDELQELLRLDPDTLRPRARSPGAPAERRLHGVAASLDPPPRPIVVEPDPQPEEPPADLDEDGVEIGGVLAEEWEYVNLLSGSEAVSRVAILSHKPRTRSRIRGVTRSRTGRFPSRRPTSPSRSRSTRPGRGRSMSLELHERKPLNPPDGPTIWVVEITPTRLVYEVQEEGWKRYSLERSPSESLYCSWREWRSWRASNRDPDERPGYFILGRPPDRRALFETRRDRADR